MHASAAISHASESHSEGFQKDALELFTRPIFVVVSNGILTDGGVLMQ